MAHTPGPWEVTPEIREDLDDDPMGVYRVEPANTELTRRYFETESETPELEAVHQENRANANLIAAAPDLYRDLKAIRDIVLSIQSETCEEIRILAPIMRQMKRIHKTLAKVEGKE